MAVPLCTLTAFALLLAGLAQHIHSHFPNETPFEAVESWLTVPSFPDHYKTLGVSRDMPFERLKAAYDEKKNKFPAHEWAFAVLSNTRAEYDEMLNNDEKTRPDRQQMRYTVTAGFSAAAVVIFYVLGSVESSWLETRRSVREAEVRRQRAAANRDEEIREAAEKQRRENEAERQRIEDELQEKLTVNKQKERQLQEQQSAAKEFLENDEDPKREAEMKRNMEIVAERERIAEELRLEEKAERKRLVEEKKREEARALREKKQRERTAREEQQASMLALQSTEGRRRRQEEAAMARAKEKKELDFTTRMIPQVARDAMEGHTLNE